MHVGDLAAAVAFFNDVLGFEAPERYRYRDYAYVHRGTVGFRLLENRGSDGAPPGNRRSADDIDVRDVDRVHGELKPRLDTLPAEGVHGNRASGS